MSGHDQPEHHDQTERAADRLSDGAIAAIKDVKTTAADKTTD